MLADTLVSPALFSDFSLEILKFRYESYFLNRPLGKLVSGKFQQ